MVLECDVCGQPASCSCARCNSIAYCSKEHQKIGWPGHQAQCAKTQKLFELAKTMGVPASMVTAIAASLSGEVVVPAGPAPTALPPPMTPSLVPLTGTSAALKDLGNAAFRRGDFTHAIAAYTAATSTCVPAASITDRAAALSNRAQVRTPCAVGPILSVQRSSRPPTRPGAPAWNWRIGWHPAQPKCIQTNPSRSQRSALPRRI